jgi:hypothetical protein
MRASAAPILASTIAVILGCGGSAARTPAGTGGAGGAQAGSSGNAGAMAGNGGAGGTLSTTIENIPFPLGARVYATATAQLQVDEVANVGITIPLFVVGTADPQSPIKLLTFDPDARTWAVKFQVNAGGALPQAAHRIDAIGVLYDAQYMAPTLLFSARREDTLENEGLFLATWDPINSGGYKVTLVDGTDVPGRAFVSIDATKISGPIVATCVDTGAASPKTAAMIWSFDQGTTMTLLGSLPGEPAIDPTPPTPPAPSPIARRPVVVHPQDESSAASALVWQRRKSDGSVVLTLTSFTRTTGFGASVDVALPTGVDLVDNSNAVSGGVASVQSPDYVVFLGSDGSLYHLEMDVPTANLALVRGPETAAQAGTSLAVGRFGGGFWNDLVQGGVPGSPGLELQIGRFAPFPLFAPRPGPMSSIATGPVRWPTSTSFRTYKDINAPPELRTFIFAVTTGASGAYDTALLSIVPPPPPEDNAMACFPSTAGPPPPPTFTCALPEPCPVATGTLPYGLSVVTAPTLDVAAGHCVLQHLRDATPAHLTVSMNQLEGAVVEDIWTEGDGTAILYRHDSQDLLYTYYAPTRLTLRDQSFFDACQQQTDAKAVFHCLFSWWIDGSCATAGAATCPAH